MNLTEVHRGFAMPTLLSFVRGLLSTMRRKRLFRTLIAASVFVAIMLTGAVRAGAEEEKFPDRFMLRLGGYHVQNADTIARLDANNLPIGTYVDFHDTLGGDSGTTVFRLDSIYRFNDHHAISFSWYDIKFSGSKVLDQDFTWNGVQYNIGTQVDSELKFYVYKLNYQYSLYHNEEVELGVSIGLHIMKTFAGINATGINETGINETQNASITAPMPVWGLFADYKFTPRFSTFFSYQYFFIDYQDTVRGGLQDSLLGFEYRLFRNVALGAAYNRFNLNLKLKGDNQTLYVDSGWNGLMLYGSVYF
jgi:hypothetical protein